MTLHALTLLLAGLTISGCTSGLVGVGGSTSKNKPDSADKLSDESEGVPGYLTCSWASVESETDASARCVVNPEGGGAGAAYEWTVSSGGSTRAAAIRVAAGKIVTLVLPAEDYLDAKIVVKVADSDEEAVGKALSKLLTGLEEDGPLRTCFEADDPLKDCFAKASVDLGPPLKGASLGFMTAKTYTGNVGGLAGADEICRGLGAKVGSSYEWESVLSDGSRSWTDAFPGGGPVLNLNGERLLDDGASTTFVSLDNSLTDETGTVEAGPIEAWLGLSFGGVPATRNCAAWTSGDAEELGNAYLITGPQFAPDCNGQCACNVKKRLLCAGIDP